MIKLKHLIKENKSQKYVRRTPELEKLMGELNKSDDYKNAPFNEVSLLENFTMIAEWVSLNKDDLYDYRKTRIKWYSFIDKNGVKHEIRILKNTSNERYEVKLWFDDDKGKPNYSPPHIYSNLKYDTSIYNTHVYILLNALLPIFFQEAPNEMLFLSTTDKARYRPYKITLNNHLDKTRYSLEDLGNNTLSVSLKQA